MAKANPTFIAPALRWPAPPPKASRDGRRLPARAAPLGRGAIVSAPRLRLPRIAVVITRSLDEPIGRADTLRAVLAALDGFADVTVLRLAHLFETDRRRERVKALLRAVGAAIVGRPPALQCLLFDHGPSRRRVADAIGAGGFDAVYFDTVRCLRLVETVRRRTPDARLVADLDASPPHHAERSLDMLRAALPSAAARLLEGGRSGPILAYEAAALRGAERRMAALTQAAALASSSERDHLARRVAPADAAKIIALPPPVTLRPAPPPAPPYHFVFVGGDRRIHNRYSIDWLLDAWNALAPSTPLHIFGVQTRPDRPTPGVIWRGFVEDASQIYQPGAIVLAPMRLGGGLEATVVEAWARGRPVLGSPLAFGGIGMADYPGCAALEAWPPLLCDPGAHQALWTAAAASGQAFVAAERTPAAYAARWRALLAPVTALRPSSVRT